VNQSFADASVRLFAPGDAIQIGTIPNSLVAGQEYSLLVTITLPENRRLWPLRGVVTVRSGRRTIGPVLMIRARGSDQGGQPGPGATATRTPTVQGSPTATRTPVPPLARVLWTPATLSQQIAAGGTADATVQFTVGAAVGNPAFRVFTRAGAVTIDPTSLPVGPLLPGQAYSLRLNLHLATERAALGESATVLLRDGDRSLGDGLAVRLVALPTA
jgi:hypothetical protein